MKSGWQLRTGKTHVKTYGNHKLLERCKTDQSTVNKETGHVRDHSQVKIKGSSTRKGISKHGSECLGMRLVRIEPQVGFWGHLRYHEKGTERVRKGYEKR